MKTFNIYYSDEYYMNLETGLKCRTNSIIQTVHVGSAEEAVDLFYEITGKVYALLGVIGHTATVTDIVEVCEPFFDDRTKEILLKDFMKGC